MPGGGDRPSRSAPRGDRSRAAGLPAPSLQRPQGPGARWLGDSPSRPSVPQGTAAELPACRALCCFSARGPWCQVACSRSLRRPGPGSRSRRPKAPFPRAEMPHQVPVATVPPTPSSSSSQQAGRCLRGLPARWLCPPRAAWRGTRCGTPDQPGQAIFRHPQGCPRTFSVLPRFTVQVHSFMHSPSTERGAADWLACPTESPSTSPTASPTSASTGPTR